jgi:DNA replication ATP-dependent helicase Dna2
MPAEYTPVFFKEMQKILRRQDLPDKVKTEAFWALLNKIFILATEEERIPFSNLFARISYVSQKYKISPRLRYRLHRFRKEFQESGANEESRNWENLFEQAVGVTVHVWSEMQKAEIPTELREALPDMDQLFPPSVEIKGFHTKVRMVITEDIEEESCLKGVEESTGLEYKVRYSLAERNENFDSSIRLIRAVFGFPVTVNLLEVEVDQEGILRPRALVIEPDFLVDVTAIAECFQPSGQEPILYLLKKLIPFQATPALIAGNIANFFLDELMANPEISFLELFPRVFQMYPLQFATMNDQEVRDIMSRAKGHFSVIHKMVFKDFEENDIQREHCYLEPTFYSETYGIQGRLDLFQDKKGASKIVELKSGKPFMPNLYGLSNNHFIQTILYDLLVKSVYQNELIPTNYILYSSNYEKPLRYAPPVKAQQMEAMGVRNHLVALERMLTGWTCMKDEEHPEKGKWTYGPVRVLDALRTDRYPQLKGFHRRDLEMLEKTFAGLDKLEKSYLKSFTGFIAREHQLAKIGAQGLEGTNGVASLWLSSFEEKEAAFDIISHLQIEINEAGEEEPIIVFRKTEKTNPLANFRVGDIAALYPFEKLEDTVLRSQVFKVTIIGLGKDHISVRLRSRQNNLSIFKRSCLWNLEHDLLDSSFNSMYRSLFEFSSAQKEKRELLLGIRQPEQGVLPDFQPAMELTTEQQHVLLKMIGSKDYFLLWGPPGTGKTSMMLKHLSAYFLQETDENILLLAYTNRAVDEICEALENIGEEVKNIYTRIGSKFGTDEKYHGQLLDAKIGKAKTREELKDILGHHRIFVSTIASFLGKDELFQLKKFSRVIIDEASQIPEPMLVGLLPKFNHFTLIGDHKQLPAVVVQDEKISSCEDQDLKAIGIENLRGSLFERLFRKCEIKGWDWAMDKLSHQGRMHAEIMEFSNSYFYGGFLKTLPEGTLGYERQHASLSLQIPVQANEFTRNLAVHRKVFIPTPVDMDDGYRKTNLFEAIEVVKIIKAYTEIFEFNQVQRNIGVITPYRAQIALIREELQKAGLNPDEFTVDTVERYQGGARDVIILSLCLNTDTQLLSMMSVSEDGTDRKLNVALTRARQHLVVIGNPELMEQNLVYKNLINWLNAGIKEEATT